MERVSSVRTTEFMVRNLNTVVRFHYTPLAKFIRTQVIPYLPKVGKNCPKHDTKLLGKKSVIPNQYGKSEVDYLILPPPQKGLNSCKVIYFVPQRCAMLERGLLKFLEQVSCSSYFIIGK